jgi:putative Holliday junction resolvase
VSDELGLYAHPRQAIHTRGERELIEEVARLAEEEAIGEVVVGLPLSMSGEDSAQTAQVRALVDRLRERLGVPVSTWDERLTSVQAGRTVREGRTRTGASDSAAAALLLQAVLDSRRGVSA